VKVKASTVVTAVVFAAVGVGVGLLLQGARSGLSFKDVAIVVDDRGQGCRARFEGTFPEGKKGDVEVGEDVDGVAWHISNRSDNCAGRELRIRAKVPSGAKKPLPGACRISIEFPGDVMAGSTLDPPPVCVFPKKAKYRGIYVYEVMLCAPDGTGCQEADPEIDVKRH
jgi:hypothetical protein